MKRTPRNRPEPQAPDLFYELRIVDEQASDGHIMPLVRDKSRLAVLNVFTCFDGYEVARREQKPLYCGDGLRVEMVAIVGEHVIVLSEQPIDEMDEQDQENAGKPSAAVA
jgi:hypothetical protein